ncbi:14 kDa zinc-binding protein-like [Pyrus communis]|uniref:14 kDa zinc-binding protein-like n=1 Tax=Pyrus communis TaxID=23211 RepID=UPI0035C0A488
MEKEEESMIAARCDKSCRVAVISSHFVTPPLPMAEKEAALAAVPSDAPLCFATPFSGSSPLDFFLYFEQVLAFRDISPQAPTHILIIPKVRDGLTGLSKAEERHTEILGQLLYAAKLIATQEGLDDGFRIVINDGPNGCQLVYHFHIHLLGGRQMNWPPG